MLLQIARLSNNEHEDVTDMFALLHLGLRRCLRLYSRAIDLDRPQSLGFHVSKAKSFPLVIAPRLHILLRTEKLL